MSRTMEDMYELAEKFVRIFYIQANQQEMAPMIDMEFGAGGRGRVLLLPWETEEDKYKMTSTLVESFRHQVSSYIFYGEAWRRKVDGSDPVEIVTAVLAKADEGTMRIQFQILRDNEGQVVDLLREPDRKVVEDVLFKELLSEVRE